MVSQGFGLPRAEETSGLIVSMFHVLIRLLYQFKGSLPWNSKNVRWSIVAPSNGINKNLKTLLISELEN